MVRTNRALDYLVAALLIAVALALSPLGLFLTKGYPSLTLRGVLMTLALDVFLLVWAGAILTQGRWRRFFFHLIVWTFPLVLLTGFEALAHAVHLAERILPITDLSVLHGKGRLPAYFSDENRSVAADPGWRLYRPRDGDGIFINELGLRTAAPTPKAPGEWRVAISGGSTVWGWRVLDVDTVPADIQRLLPHTARRITVYNFGIEGATLEAELLTLKRFREIYAIDEVVFYTGSNDELKTFWEATTGRKQFDNFIASGFELGKAARRVNALLQGTNASYLAKFESEILPKVLRDNSLRRGVVAAEDYCRNTELDCVFALQPTLVTRKNHPAGEARLAKSYDILLPGMALLTRQMYRDAMAAGPTGRMYDLTNLFDDQTSPFFMDHIHVNEDGNRMVAQALVPILLKGTP
ncbi:MAG: SGNH/GDSL hydrolase family protein [Hyphomicrobiales bacterium]|nr:SGNH/GDSL hydrolase family protein [Hyphomicrobiales bacterium]MBV8824683.1 SGNH/GDSL hydrolase family protein [Hyphomicrobiales bacterium]MBV9426295.1 SGNH/GDSL hydrolase family protein [Bradyrhizobiaceae bacterium]